MELSPQLNDTIEREMAAVHKNDILRPGMGFDDFSKEYANVLAQADEDEAPLTRAGFDFTLMPKYYGYLDKLASEHADRVNAEADRSASQQAFAAAMSKANTDNSRLMTLARYVVKRSGRPEDRRVYNEIRKGVGDVSTLNDNLALVGFIRRNADLASEVRPGGVEIDETVLTNVEEESFAFLKLRAKAAASKDDASANVERQNQLITLCIRALREIKLFAEMAFYDDVDRYNRFYASPSRRAARQARPDTEDSDTQAS
jgi:hypothetical protein